jgi:hypothetical protein
MVKISANISKKVPIPGTEFSSQQYGASMEIEVSDADKPDVIQARIRELYALVTQAVDEQIGAATQGGPVSSPAVNRQHAPPPPAPAGRTGYAAAKPAGRTNGNGNIGRKTGATEAQQRAIYAICKSLNLDMAAVLADYNVTDAGQLSVKDASRLIDDLKGRQTANQQPAR